MDRDLTQEESEIIAKAAKSHNPYNPETEPASYQWFQEKTRLKKHPKCYYSEMK